MKKILFLVQLPPPVHGASIINKYVVNIFKNSNYKIKVIELKFVNEVSEIGSLSSKKIVKMLITSWNILKALIYFKPDFVYFTLAPTGGAFYRDVLFVAILKLLNSKIIYHLHGKGIKENLKKQWKALLYKFVFKNCVVIHLSKLLENDIKGLGYSKIYFVPNGIENVNFQKGVRKEKRESNKVQLLFLSNLAISKGILVLIKASKLLKERKINFNLSIVGKEFDISFEELNNKIKEFKLENNVKILGPKYNDEKKKILENTDIFVFPTFNDCFPLVLLEAMQFELPIITTFEGAIPEIVDDGVTGFLVPQKDTIALAEKIEILIKDKDLRKKMGEAGRKKFLEKYTLEKFEENIKKVFENLYD